MRIRARCAALTVAALCLCAAGLAQYQDRDSSGASPTSASAPPPEQRVDINHASLQDLVKVPGLTVSWAGRIVRFRPYRTKQDLVDKGVVSSAVYDRIKDFIIAHHEKP
jgi:DNA uptake protein ComE-like DNA-binding protein